MKTEKRIHQGYIEWEDAKQRGIDIPLMFGKYQYIFSSEKGKISLIQLKDYYRKGQDIWEIYCLQGELFEDTERFNTKREAIKRIKELFDKPISEFSKENENQETTFKETAKFLEGHGWEKITRNEYNKEKSEDKRYTARVGIHHFFRLKKTIEEIEEEK